MLICSCKGVTDRKIEEQVRNGARTIAQVQDGCQAGTECGGCLRQIHKLLAAGGAAARGSRER